MNNENVNITPDKSAVAEVPHDTQSNEPRTQTASAGGRFELVSWTANLIVDKFGLRTSLTFRDESGRVFPGIPCFINDGYLFLLQFREATQLRGIEDPAQSVSVLGQSDFDVTPTDLQSIFEQLRSPLIRVLEQVVGVHCYLPSATNEYNLIDPDIGDDFTLWTFVAKNDSQ